MFHRHSLLAALAIVIMSAVGSARAASYTVQNGLSGYTQQTNEALVLNFGASGNTQWGQAFHGGSDRVEVISSTNSALQRSNALVRFLGLDSIVGAGEVVTSATLVLTSTFEHASAVDRDLFVNRALQAWTDSTNGVDGGGGTYWTNWGNGGTDAGFTGSEMAHLVTPGKTPIGQTLSIALDPAVIQDWIDNASSNHGMLITMPHGANGYFQTFEGSGESNAPILLIETVPEPASAVLLGLGSLMLMARSRRTE